jgi:hypothetical protein
MDLYRRNELDIQGRILEEIMDEAKALAEDEEAAANEHAQMAKEGLTGAIPYTNEPLLKNGAINVRLRIRDSQQGSDPYQGIDPDDFVAERTRLHFVHQLESGVEMQAPARNLKRAWRIMAGALNAHLADGQLEPNYPEYRRVHEVAIGLGGGKSTGLSIYASCLAALAGEPSRCPGLVLVCERIEDVDHQAKQINKISQEWYGAKGEFAVGWHHKTNDRRKTKGLDTIEYKDLSRYPFLICTQASLTYALAVEAVDQFEGKRLGRLMKYDYKDPEAERKHPYQRWNPGSDNQGSRIGIVFDEAIIPFKSYSITKDLLLGVVEMLDPVGLPEWMAKKHTDVIDQLKMLMAEMDIQQRIQGRKNALEGTKDKTNSVSVDLARWKEQLKPLAELMSDIHTSQWTFDGWEKWKIVNDLANVYFVLQEAKPLFYWKTTKFKEQQFQFSQFILHRLGRGFVCLDATARESKLYSAFPEVHREAIMPTQDFTGLKFLTDVSRGCSRGSMNGELSPAGEKLKAQGRKVPYTEYSKAPETARLLWDDLTSNWKSYLAKAIGYEEVGKLMAKELKPQIGVIAHTPVIDGLKELKEKHPEVSEEVNIVFGNVGGVRGSNKFRRCQVLWVVGLNFMSYDWMKETRHGINALVQMLEETDLPMSGDTLYLDEQIKKIKSQIPEEDIDLYYGELIRDTLQTVGRSAARTSTHELDNGMAACAPAAVLLSLKHRSEVTTKIIKALKETFVNCTVKENGWRLDPKTKEGLIDKRGIELAKELLAEGPFRADMVLRWYAQCHNGKDKPIRDIVKDYFIPKGMPNKDIEQFANNTMTQLTSRVSKRNQGFMQALGIKTIRGKGIQQKSVWLLSKS